MAFVFRLSPQNACSFLGHFVVTFKGWRGSRDFNSGAEIVATAYFPAGGACFVPLLILRKTIFCRVEPVLVVEITEHGCSSEGFWLYEVMVPCFWIGPGLTWRQLALHVREAHAEIPTSMRKRFCRFFCLISRGLRVPLANLFRLFGILGELYVACARTCVLFSSIAIVASSALSINISKELNCLCFRRVCKSY